MQKKKGISLIVLVITIIVMIVLAGAIILSLNNSGIIQKANEAVKSTDEATIKELSQMAWAEAYASGVRNVEDTYVNGEKVEGFQTRVKASLEANGIDTDEYSIKVTTTGVSIIKSVTTTVDSVPIPKGFVASNATGENKKDKGLVIYEGTEEVNNINVEVARRSRNQFVWVPVDKTNFDTSFVRKNFGFDNSIVNTVGTSYWEVLATTELNDTNLQYITKETLKEVQAMYASVKKYGGFYIGRYEVGIDEQRITKGNVEDLHGIKPGTKVYSVMGKIPYSFVPWTWNNAMNEDTNGAVEIARRMYTENNSNYGVVSTLTYGVQWDRTVQWLIETGVLTLAQVNHVGGSTTLGNHSDTVINSKDELTEGALVWDYTASTKGSFVPKGSETLTYPKESGTMWMLSTGALKSSNINNIYDISGNMYEWIMEAFSTGHRVARAGYFEQSGKAAPLACRVYHKPSGASQFLRFQISIIYKIKTYSHCDFSHNVSFFFTC